MHCVDLGESFLNSNEYLLAKIGVDTAENEPLKVHLIFKLSWDLIFTEPLRPGGILLLVAQLIASISLLRLAPEHENFKLCFLD